MSGRDGSPAPPDTGPDADRTRDLAIRCAQEKDLREYIPLIRKYASAGTVEGRGPKPPPTHDVVRIAALDALSKWGDEDSRPAFESAAASPVPRLQRAG